jgi:tetratricopeptide (TPR) repeat protein
MENRKKEYLEEALEIQKETVAMFPQDGVSRNLLAQTLKELNRFEEAYELYRETIAMFPHDVVARNGSAEVLTKTHRLEEALEIQRETIAMFPHNVVARNVLAEILQQMNRFEEALEISRETIAMFPQDVVSRNSLSEILRQLNRLQEALDIQRETASMFPDDLVTNVGLADTLSRMKRLPESIELYRELNARFPSNPVIRNGLANTLLRYARSQKEDYDTVVDHNTEDYRYQVALSFAGEDRAIARDIAQKLISRGITVFYDEYEKAELWGKDLYQHLSSVYGDQAAYCIILLSKHYAKKLWTRHELKQAQARAFRDKREYILPLRLDDTEVPGITETVGYINLRKDSIETVVSAVLKKLGESS